MNITIRRAIELGLFVGLYVGVIIFIEASSPGRKSQTPLQITDIQATIAEVQENAPALLEELPVEPAAAVSGSRDPKPPAVPPPVAITPAQPVEPAREPAVKPQLDPQPVPPRPLQRQCQPVFQPEPACRRHGIGGLFQWLNPFSDN